MKGKRKKRPVTLIEIMIVILLIGLIGGALAVNMRGSMDKGKVFKTEQNISRVYDALMLEYAKGTRTLEQIITDRREILENSPFIQDAAKVIKDGWGADLEVVAQGEDDISVFSTKLRQRENG